MNGVDHLYIPICGLINSILLIICFFSKKNVKNKETAIFGRILIYSLVECLVMCAILVIVILNRENNLWLPKLLNKIDYFMYILWISNFFLYIYLVASKKNKHLYDSLFWITSVFDGILGLTILFSDVSINTKLLYSEGSALIVTYIGCGLYFLLILGCLIYNTKSIFNKKLSPLYTLILLAIIVFVMNQVDKTIILVSTVLSYVDLIMYFTIENPDIRMIEKMKFAKNEAEKANRAKSDFLSSMSHEIRTPLNAIVGLSEDNIKYKDEMPYEVLENSNDIINASQTLLGIVGNILDINKIESNMMEVISAPYKFKEEITNMCKVTLTRIGDKDIRFNLNISNDIPEELIGDKEKIKGIINNLLSNAIKYTESGRINLDVKCINDFSKNITNLIIVCQDTGRGIKPEMLKRLFNKFDRLDIEKNTTTEGTGLGLVITKSLVEMMGGKINVSSVYGEGSTFTININQRINKLSTEKSEKSIGEEIDLKQYAGKKVLIVDDNKLNIKVTKKSLEDFNFELDECYDGIECLEKINSGKTYDLILMDIMMPNMSGEEAMMKLKEIGGFNTPVVALTADAVAGSEEKYRNEGFVDYIAKPFSKDIIKKKIYKIMS